MMKMNLENTAEGGFEYEKRVWAARCKSEEGAGCSEGTKDLDGRKVLCQCEEQTFYNVPCDQKKGEDLYTGRVWRCYLKKFRGKKKLHMGRGTRRENSKPNSRLKTKWIEYSEYVGKW